MTSESTNVVWSMMSFNSVSRNHERRELKDRTGGYLSRIDNQAGRTSPPGNGTEKFPESADR